MASRYTKTAIQKLLSGYVLPSLPACRMLEREGWSLHPADMAVQDPLIPWKALAKPPGKGKLKILAKF
ncbi:hypothetical protein [Allosphingosinicella vermicomposti]|uniref:hypothetical protein n=1 Tax=Allosphingosinicella vermicomposti TaxID=614671 RepID=UPI00131A4CCA|nr:hypothetical protein [Allosphingosinicella vermicomposti]